MGELTLGEPIRGCVVNLKRRFTTAALEMTPNGLEVNPHAERTATYQGVVRKGKDERYYLDTMDFSGRVYAQDGDEIEVLFRPSKDCVKAICFGCLKSRLSLTHLTRVRKEWYFDHKARCSVCKGAKGVQTLRMMEWAEDFDTLIKRIEADAVDESFKKFSASFDIEEGRAKFVIIECDLSLKMCPKWRIRCVDSETSIVQGVEFQVLLKTARVPRVQDWSSPNPISYFKPFAKRIQANDSTISYYWQAEADRG